MTEQEHDETVSFDLLPLSLSLVSLSSSSQSAYCWSRSLHLKCQVKINARFLSFNCLHVTHMWGSKIFQSPLWAGQQIVHFNSIGTCCTHKSVCPQGNTWKKGKKGAERDVNTFELCKSPHSTAEEKLPVNMISKQGTVNTKASLWFYLCCPAVLWMSTHTMDLNKNPDFNI